MRSLVITWGILILGLWSWASAGTKEELQRLQQDILQLQNLIRTMQEIQGKNGGIIQSLLEQLNDQTAQTNAAVNSLTAVLRSRAGGEDQLARQFQDAFQKLVVKLDDTNNRIAALQQKVDQSQMRVQSLRSYKPDIMGGVEPDRVYSAAYNDYIMGNYDLAIAAFRDFLSTFPDSEYSDNAAYYLGVSLMEQGRYEAAISAFDEVLNLYPQADKTTPAYYKKAVSLLQVQRNADAIETFRKLITLYPESPEA
ncbi:MAG: tetratricopeptide repeat protein, partial [Acidobacteriota bacterium]